MCRDYIRQSTFYKAMEEMYDDPHRVNNAAQALDNLKQGRNDVEEYITDFKHLALESEWNEPALIAQFRKGLSEALKDGLARTGVPPSLDKTMSLCIEIDRRIRERRAERANNHQSTPIRRFVPPPPSMSSIPTDNDEEPMQVGAARGPLTEAEKSRRRSLGLCMYCGHAGHQVRECREKPNTRMGKPLALHAFVSVKSICTAMSTHLIGPLSLQWDGRITTLNAMIDSGASGCFLDAEVTHSLGIPTTSKKQPYPIQLLDGSSPLSGPVTKETTPLIATIGKQPQDILIFDIVPSPLFPAVLGLNWLRRNNPTIDWTNGTVTFNQKDFSTTSEIPQTQIHTAAMCTEIPKAYQDLHSVFEKKGADDLPPFRTYDCPIDLLPGAPIPHGRIYPLSEPELESLKEYISENLKKGFIRPLTIVQWLVF
uniref:CCHC-type domain-containing protein n=1 Tax=Leptobrachium leishanense TaxID=445787 RepID=A0A8C5PQD8_9ANUR